MGDGVLISVALAFLTSPIGRWVAGAAAVITVALGLWAWADVRAYRRGAEAVTSAVKAQDARAVAAADKAKLSVNACFDAGKEWDQTKGACRD